MPAHSHSPRPGASTYRQESGSPVPRGTLDRRIRRALQLVVRDLGHQPSDAYSDVCGRSETRPLGTVTLEGMLVAAWRDGATLESALGVAEALREFIVSLYGDEQETLRDAFDAETRHQAEADVAQHRALIDRTPAALDDAIERTAAAIVATQRLQEELIEERRRAAEGGLRAVR